MLLEFRGAYSQSRGYSHPDNADAVREILQSDEIHALRYHRQARYRHQNRCESRMITTGTLASDPVMHQHSGHHLLCEPHRPAASQGMSAIRMCRFLYAQTCATCRMGGASPSTFADLCTDVCPDMHQSSDAGRHLRDAASSPGLRRPRHTERTECHDIMLCQRSAHSAGLCMPRHTEQTGHQTPAQSRAARPHTRYSITETPHPTEISFRCSGYGALDTADGRHLIRSTAATVTVHFHRRRRRRTYR